MSNQTWKERVVALLYSLIFPAIFLACQALSGVIVSFYAGMSAAAEMIRLGSTDESAILNRAMEYTMSNAMVASAASGLLTVAMIALWLKRKKQPFLKTLQFSPIPVRHTVCVLGTGLGMYGTTCLLLAYLPFPDSMVEEYESLVGSQITGSDPMMSVLAVVLIAPLAEELVFRGMCMGALKRAFPIWATIPLQGCIFAACHLVPYQMIYVLPCALALGLVYHWSGSILASLLCHVTYNFLGVLAGMLEPEVLEGPLVNGLLYAGPVLAAVALIALYRSRTALTAQI